jgi:transcription elongation factor GreA
MAKLRLLCSQGDRVVEWDPRQAEAGERAARAAVEEAERIFETARRGGATAFKVEPGRPAERLERFDPRVDELVIVPRVAGGAISPGDRTVMTRAGAARLEEELARLRTVDRAELAARLSDARESPGDQSDNLELLEAQHDLSILEARIAELEYALAQAKVVEAPSGDSAEVGSVVMVRDDEGEEESYTLVGPAEAKPREGLNSIASPVGRALLGARVGDEALVETPAGVRRLTVLKGA